MNWISRRQLLPVSVLTLLCIAIMYYWTYYVKWQIVENELKIPGSTSSDKKGGESIHLSMQLRHNKTSHVVQVTDMVDQQKSNVVVPSQTQDQEKHVRYVVVFANPRTGSSFTGELFNKSLDAFYIYEPLHAKHRMLSHPRPLNNSLYDDYVSQIWESVLTCNFTLFTILTQIDNSVIKKSNLIHVYTSCMKDKNSDATCLTRLEAVCKSKTLRTFKTVRSTMESAEIMLRRGNINPEKFRLIHVMRDPRAQFQSRLSGGSSKPSKAETYNRGVCLRGYKDIALRKKLSNLYPKSFYGLHYEDLAHEPLHYAGLVYQFVHNKPLPSAVESWLSNSTQCENSPEAQFGTTRKNSSNTAEAWKDKMSNKIKKNIDKVCLDYYNISEYYSPI